MNSLGDAFASLTVWSMMPDNPFGLVYKWVLDKLFATGSNAETLVWLFTGALCAVIIAIVAWALWMLFKCRKHLESVEGACGKLRRTNEELLGELRQCRAENRELLERLIAIEERSAGLALRDAAEGAAGPKVGVSDK